MIPPTATPLLAPAAAHHQGHGSAQLTPMGCASGPTLLPLLHHIGRRRPEASAAAVRCSPTLSQRQRRRQPLTSRQLRRRAHSVADQVAAAQLFPVWMHDDATRPAPKVAVAAHPDPDATGDGPATPRHDLRWPTPPRRDRRPNGARAKVSSSSRHVVHGVGPHPRGCGSIHGESQQIQSI